MRIALLSLVVVGCGSSSPEQAQPLPLERVSPPQFTSHDVFIGARGDVVVLAGRLSRDRGATWQSVDPRLGMLERVTIDGAVIGTFANGLVRWNLESGDVTTVPGPAFTSARNWRTQPGGRFIAFDEVDNAIAFEGAAGWTTSALPQPGPTEVDPYISDIASNGTIALAASAWGVFRSTDGGASWQRVERLAQAGRVLVVLPDGRFVLLGGAKTYRFDAAGSLAGNAPGMTVEHDQVAVCGDAAVIARGMISRDAGATWSPLLGGGDLSINVVRVSCGDGYWVLGYSDAWGYRLLRYDPATATALVAGNWELAGDPTWANGGPPIVRDAEGTLFAAGLVWREGEETWTLRELPARTWLAGDVFYGMSMDKLFTSHDAGRTWSALPARGLEGVEVETFAATGTELLASAFSGGTSDGLDEWRARIWRSTDGGTSWTIAYDGVATRPQGGGEITGAAHRFVGVAADGAWIATGAVSTDGGQSWQPTDADGDRSLAFLTPLGHLVTTLPGTNDVWRVYADGGLGELRATWALQADGEIVPASQLRSVAFDDDGFAYVARGVPYVQVWRTTQPLR